MVVDDTAGSEYRSADDKEVDLNVDANADAEGHVDVEMAAFTSEVQSPTEAPPEEGREPRQWKWAVIFLCFYGFMASIKPGEPFITPYLLSHEKNFTREQVSGFVKRCIEIFPYSCINKYRRHSVFRGKGCNSFILHT